MLSKVELTKLNEAILSKENLSQSEILELLKTGAHHLQLGTTGHF